MPRESMNYDVVIVGAGPAGLACACKIKQVDASISVCVLEKGAEVGAHILSGAIFETRALDELFHDWHERGAPLGSKVKSEQVLFLRNKHKSYRIPSFLAPKTFRNKGNYIISLGVFCRWLAVQAESLGVEIFSGFTAKELLYDEQSRVTGVATGDMGADKHGQPKSSFQPGIELHAHYTVLGEGCRGHLGKQLIKKHQLNRGRDPQHYALGFKELWQVPQDSHQSGLIAHTAGWPLRETGTHGGGFLYRPDSSHVAVGLVVDLSYKNCYLDPFQEFQRFKHHPEIAKHLEGGERLTYGARAISKGGLQSQPKLHAPGALLVGDDAGTLNFAKIKGAHTAMKSGMVAAETIVAAIAARQLNADLSDYQDGYNASWVFKELKLQRNFGPAQQRWGNLLGSAYAFLDINLFSGELPWTLGSPLDDRSQLKTSDSCAKPLYPGPDGKISFDKLSSVYLSNTNHEEDQPCHLKIKDSQLCQETLQAYAEPAQRYCPAGVYEIIASDRSAALEVDVSSHKLHINSQNCIHCKACDIKDPFDNISWTPPEGGGGPNYPNM